MLNNLIDRIKLPFRKEKELFSSLRQIMGFYPHDISYYKLALMHKSVMKRNAKGKPINNERLEFLGDAILDAIVGDIVYRHFPGKREGFLTNTRSKLVQRDTLNKLAQSLGLSKLILSSGRSSSHNSYMGGNAFEALVGAIYLDRGYDACMAFMQNRILAEMINIDKVAYKEVNFKSKLIEWSQKNRVQLDFKMLNQKKDDNGNPTFSYEVMLEGVQGCAGNGYSKKESQQLASKLTLEKLRREPQFIDQVFAAKTNRTKMEEEPVENVPTTDAKDDFVITKDIEKEASAEKHENTFREEVFEDKPRRNKRRPPMYRADNEVQSVEKETADTEEFDLSDISAGPQSKEDIIKAAEEAAFNEA
uniref:Ribonuclease 3 n=3 Tax=unclassified Prevotella TaxID=2638335 RepID=A0AB33JJM1_9BACT